MKKQKVKRVLGAIVFGGAAVAGLRYGTRVWSKKDVPMTQKFVEGAYQKYNSDIRIGKRRVPLYV
jgi:hypothetical protein